MKNIGKQSSKHPQQERKSPDWCSPTALAVVIQLDQAGWHGPQTPTRPNGIRLVFQPSHSPELQPAEHLPMLAFIAIAANIWPK